MTIEMNEEMVSEVEIQQILNEYHKKQLIENLTGPCASFVLHFVLLLLMFIFIVSQPKKKQPEIMVNIVEVETIEIKPYRQTIPPVPSPKKSKKTVITENFNYEKNMAKWQAAREYARVKGCEFIIFTEKDIGIDK